MCAKGVALQSVFARTVGINELALAAIFVQADLLRVGRIGPHTYVRAVAVNRKEVDLCLLHQLLITRQNLSLPHDCARAEDSPLPAFPPTP